jgi:hypothetical protein
MKNRFLLWFVLAISWLWVVPQLYVGTYDALIGRVMFLISAVVIIFTCIWASWLIFLKFKVSILEAIPYFFLFFWMVVSVFMWKIIYTIPNQVYKLIWLYIGLFSPFWALLALALTTYSFRNFKVL